MTSSFCVIVYGCCDFAGNRNEVLDLGRERARESECGGKCMSICLVTRVTCGWRGLVLLFVYGQRLFLLLEDINNIRGDIKPAYGLRLC